MADLEQLSKLLQTAKEYGTKYNITEKSSDAEKLRFELMQNDLSEKECLELRQKVVQFMKSDAPDSAKEMIKGYTESLSMICSAIEANMLH